MTTATMTTTATHSEPIANKLASIPNTATGRNGMAIANEINRQIGARAFRMLGTRAKVADTRSLTFDIRGSRRFNKIMVALAYDDTYTITFLRVSRAAEITRSETRSYVHADQLHVVIEATTGLFVSLESIP